MNLGELIVDLSLDYAEFNQSLEQAKKAASSAAASIEKSFQKLSLTVEVDDSALYDLNKHLDLKYRHFKEINQYFKNNPLTPTVDDGELTELNKTLKELTKSKHTVTIEQRINAKLTDSSKRQMAESVSEGVADGVEKGVAKGLHDMDKMIAKAVTDGIRAGEKSFSGTSVSSPSKGSGDSIGDVVSEIKDGFSNLQKEIGNQLLGDAVKIILKPAKDLLQGFTEGITNDIGKQLSKGIQETFGKQLGADFKKMGEQAGNSVLNAFGIKVKKENKLLTAIGDGSQIAVKSLSKSVERYAVRKLNKALTDSLDDIFSELFSLDVGTSSNRKPQAQVKKTRVYRRTRQNTSPTSTSYTSEEIPDPWGDVPQVQVQPLNIPDIAKKTTILNIPIKKKQKEAEKVLLENSFTPFEKAAHESNKQFGYVINEVGKINVANSIVGGGNQTVKRVATEITKVKNAHQKAYSTFKNLLESAKDLGDYGLVDQIYKDFIQNSQAAKAKIDALLKEGKDAGLTQHGYNKLAGAKSGISRSIGKSSGSIPSKYQAVGRQAESEAVAIGKNVVAGLGIGVDNKAFAKFGLQNATAYLLAIKKAFGIASPAKVMILIGQNIIQGLSIGLQSILSVLRQSVSVVAGVIKKGLQMPNLIPSENIKSFDSVIENSLGSAAQATKNVYAKGKDRTTLPGVVLGNILGGAVNLDLVPKSIAIPTRHLGAFYQGATDVNQMNPKIAREAEILTIFRMIEEAQKSKGVLPESGVIPSRYGAKLPDTRHVLGGFNYNQNKQGGLNINDVYDWADDDSLTPFKLPKDMGSKIFKMLQKYSEISKLLGFKLEDLGGEQAFTKTNSEGKALFSFINSKGKDFALGHAFHNMVGGKPYIQTHEVSPRRTDELLSVGTKAYKDSKGDLNKFLFHPEIQKQLKQQSDQIGENLPNAFVSGFSKGRSPMLKAIRSGFGGVIDVTKAVFQIASPAKVMIWIGRNIVQGLILGVQQQLPKLSKAVNDIKDSILETKGSGGTLGEFISNALKAGATSLLGSAGIGGGGIGSIIGNLTSGNMAALLPQLMSLLVPILGLKGLKLGDTIVKILNNNLAIKPGFLNDLFKSLTGIKLEKTGFISAVTNTLGISKGSKSPITSPMEVISKQIGQNLGSVGTGGSIPKLVENTGQMLVSAVLRQFGVSGAVGVAIEAMVKSRIANFANLGIFTKTGGKGIGGRIRGIAESYAQGDVDGVINKSSKLAGTIFRTIGFKVDMKQLTLVMGTAIAGITAFHKAFTKEGLNIGQALIKGFKEAQKNWGNAFDDMKIKAKQAMGMDVLDDLTANIRKKIKQGTVVSRETFGEFFDAVGKRFKDTKLNGDKEGIFGNIIAFVTSIATMIAPITTMAASLLPMIIPLMPLLGALGGLAIMVGRHIAGLANTIKEVEPLQRRLNFLGGSPAGGEREMKYAQGVANRLNVPVKEGIQAYSQLAIAARGTKLEGDGVRELYEGISASLSALGIAGQDASLVFMAYTQILAKGKLSMEELRQQLGEKFPPAMGIFAKSLGVSVAELGQLVSKGALLSEDILPKVAKTLQEDYGKSAANSTGSFTVALTRLGNTGFDIAIKLTKAFGGTFAMFTNFGAGLLGIFRDALDQIIPLFGSLMIGVTAVVGVGLATILNASPIAKFLTTAQNAIVAGLGSLMINLAPFYAGIIADIADGWLGAQNDLMENMMKGVGNMAVSLIVAFDNYTRDAFDTSLFSDFIGKKEAGNPFQGMIDGLGSLFRIIPSGIVELGALVLMFEQVQVLFKSFLWPTITGGWKAFISILGNFARMATPVKTIISELLVNTNDLIRGDALDRRFAKLRFGEQFGNAWKTGLAAIKAGLKALIPLALEAAIALGVILFARSDFTNPISDSLGKMATGINSAIKSINGSLDDLANKFDNAGKAAKDMADTLPSKGLELNIEYSLGIGGKSFKTDDLADSINRNDVPWFLQSGQSGAEKAKAESLKKEAESYGLYGLFTGQEKYIKLSQTQLLNQVKDIQKNKNAFNQFLEETGLTAGTDFPTNVKKAANQVRELDKQLFNLGQKRSKLGLLNTSASKIQIAELDKQLMALEKQRGVAAKEIVNINAQVKEVGTFDPKTGELASGLLKDTMDAIREKKELPLDVRMKLIADLKPMEDAIKLASQKIAKLPVDPLKEIYTRTINALRDFEVAYEKFQSNLTIKTANQQESLYSSGLNAGNINREASLISLREQEARKVGIEADLKIRQRTLNNLNSITNFGKTDEQKKELDELRKAIKDDNEAIAKMGADIAKARRDIRQSLVDQTKQVADYYRTAVKEARAVSIEFEKAQKTLENSRMQNKLREALIGAGDNIYTQFVEGIINIISQTADIEKQQLEVRKQRIDYENNIQDIRIQAAELQRSLPGKIIPLDSSIADNFNLSLKKIDDTVDTINSSVEEVASSLSNDVVNAAKKANAELDKVNQSVQDIDKTTNSWIENFSSKFADLVLSLKNGFGGVGDAISGLQVKTATWLGSIGNAPGLLQNLVSGLQPAVTGIFGKEAGQQLEQGVKQLASDPLGAVKRFFGVKGGVSFVENSRSSMDSAAGHIGDDIFAPIGSKIFAPLDGTVAQSRVGGTKNTDDANPLVPGYQPQQLVIIKLDMPIEFEGRKVTHLNMRHLLDRNVQVGQKVRMGDLLGTVGEAGGRGTQFGPKNPGTPKDADAAHLHIEYAPGENMQRGSLPDAQASRLTAKLSQSYRTAAKSKGGREPSQQPKQSPPVPKLPNLPNLDPRIDTKFLQDVSKIAQSVGANPEDLLKTMLYETGGTLSPSKRNPRTKATGLIQFMPATARGLGTNIDALSQMTPQEQLFFVQKYLKQNSRGQKLDSFRKVLSTVFAGNPNASLGVGDGDITLGNYLKKAESRYGNTARQLTQIVVDGKAIDPDSMQSLVTEAARLKLDTAYQQREMNRVNSSLSIEQIRENELRQRLEAYRLIMSSQRTAFGDISSTKDSTLGTRRTVLEGLSPNMSNAGRFGIQIQDLQRKLEKDVEALQQIIRDTDGAIAQKPDLQAAFDLAMKKFPDDPKLAANAIETNDLSFKATAFRNAEAKNNLAFLQSNINNILVAAIEDYNKKEFFRLREQDISQQSKVIEQLQQQLQLVQKLEEADPLNPLVLSIPALQKNIESLSITRDQYQQLLDLQRRYYDGGGKGGNMSEEAFQKEFRAILNVNSAKREGVDLNFNYADTVKRIKFATDELTKAQTLQSSRVDAVKIRSDRFNLQNKETGLVDIQGIKDQFALDSESANIAFQKLVLENSGNFSLSSQERLLKTLRDYRNFVERQNLSVAENINAIKEGELKNQQVMINKAFAEREAALNYESRSSNIENLKSDYANPFYVNALKRQLESEKLKLEYDKSLADLNVRLETESLGGVVRPEGYAESLKTDLLNNYLERVKQVNRESKDFNSTIKDIAQQQLTSLSSGLTDVIMGTKSFGDALNSITNAFLSGALNALFNSWFSGEGGIGSLFGLNKNKSGVNKNKGGVIPNYADGGVIGAIGDALQRERQASGVKPVLAALTPGERVLTVRQNKRFEELQMEKVLNYADGGVVGRAVPSMSFTAPSQSSSVNIDIPINVSNGDSSTSVDVPQLRNSIRSAVLAEIQRQQRPGGALNK